MRIEVLTANGKSYFTEMADESNQPVQFYRKPHDVEIINYDSEQTGGWRYGGNGYRGGKVRQTVIDENKGMPEVFRVKFPDQTVPLACRWIKLWREINPMLAINSFSSLLADNAAWTNKTGFTTRYNCLTGGNAGEKDPAFHASIICGGAILKGVERNGFLEIEAMNIADPTPTAEWLLARPWLWYYGTTVIPNGKVNLFMKMGVDGQMYPARIPILVKEPIKWPLEYLHKLPLGSPLPGATWMAV